MNHYKYIVLQIQDLSTSEFVHSIVGEEDFEEQSFILSDNPIQYYVKSDDIEGLLAAKEIMTIATDSIYEVKVMSNEYETDSAGNDVAVMTSVPGYLDNLRFYNWKVIEARESKGIKKHEYLEVKKINKNRFQIIENFTSHSIEEIALYD